MHLTDLELNALKHLIRHWNNCETVKGSYIPDSVVSLRRKVYEELAARRRIESEARNELELE